MAARTTWYAVRISGSFAGSATESEARRGHRVHARSETLLRVKRLGTALTLSIETAETTDVERGFVSAAGAMRAGGLESRVWMRRAGDSLVVRETTAGRTRRRAVPWRAGALSQWEAGERLRRWLRGALDSLTVEVVEPMEGGFERVTWRRRARDTLDVNGRATPVTVLERTSASAPAAASVESYDADGRLVRSVTPLMGLRVVLERTTPATLARLDPDPDLDIIRRALVPCVGCDAVPRTWNRVRLRVPFAGATPPRGLEGAGQSLVETGAGFVVIECRRGERAVTPATSGERARWLRPDRDVQSDAPELRAVAERLRAGADDDTAFARAAVRWVGEAIHEKGYGQGFASALDVLRTRSGDCTEHSVLLAAVLRAGGVPARPVAGLVWTREGFAGHMWVEAALDGWRALDALDPDFERLHVRLAEVTPGAGGAALADAFAVAGTGAVRVESVEPR